MHGALITNAWTKSIMATTFVWGHVVVVQRTTY